MTFQLDEYEIIGLKDPELSTNEVAAFCLTADNDISSHKKLYPHVTLVLFSVDRQLNRV